MSEPRFDMEEYDEAGDLVASYIQSFSKRSETDVARVDVVVSAFEIRLTISTLTRRVVGSEHE